MTRGRSAADANPNDPAEDTTVAGNVAEESTVVGSVPEFLTATAHVPVLDSTSVSNHVPEENPTVVASVVPEAAVGENSLFDYLHLVGNLEKRVSRTDDQSLALSSSNVSGQHRKRAVTVENSFVEGLSAIGESYECIEIDISTVINCLLTFILFQIEK